MKLIISIIALFLVSNGYSYVKTRTIYDQNLRWEQNNVTVYLDPEFQNQSNFLISENDIISQTQNYFNIWNSNSSKSFNLQTAYGLGPSSVSNSIRFSSDPSIFGSGVLAVTSIDHSAATGEIYKADILINDSISNTNKFSSSLSATGSNLVSFADVISHELGHFFGLGHSEVPESTMVFSVFKGQHNPKSDDLNGLRDIYNIETHSGVIKGSIKGGNQIGVFGAQVQAISLSDGLVVTSVISEEDGSFELKNLNPSDNYILYVLPIRDKNNLPDFYNTAQTQYCNGSDYVPAFYTKCGGRSKGEPQAFSLSSNNILDVGDITIRCDQNLNTDYLLNKTKNVREVFSLDMSNNSKVFTGYFSQTEIEDNITDLKDEFELDLSHLDTSIDNYLLDVKVLVSTIGTNMSLVSTLNHVIGGYADFPSYDSVSGKLETNIHHNNIVLSSTPSQNVFTLTLNPYQTSSSDAKGIFGSEDTMTNELSTYTIIATVTRVNNSGFSEKFLPDSYPYADNHTCLESNITVGTSSNTPFSSSDISASSEGAQTALTCGSIDLDNNDPKGGFMSFCLGVLLSIVLLFFNRKRSDFFV